MIRAPRGCHVGWPPGPTNGPQGVPAPYQRAMALLRTALACVLGVVLLTPQTASGGGWFSWIHLDRTTVAPGQHIEVDAEAWFRSAAAAEAAQEPGRFYVYLLRDFDYGVVERAMGQGSPGNWWSLGGAEAIQVGQVTISVPQRSNLGRARAAFTVPELPSARYHLMLCDAGCARPLATVIPATGFTVVADPATAQLAQRVDGLEGRIRSKAGELKAAHTKADRALEEVRSSHSGVDRLEARVSSSADEGGSVATPWAYAGWLIAGGLAGALVLRVVRRRQPRPPGRNELGEEHVSDEELRDLLSSEAGHSR